MRTIETFVLRLLVDADEPDTLRGSLRSISGTGEYSFADAPALTELLRRLTAQLAPDGNCSVVRNRADNAIQDH